MKKLHTDASVPMTNTKYTLKHVEQFQNILKDKYQLVVISSTFFNKPLYTGFECEKKIYIYHHDDHYDLITDVNKFYPNNNKMCNVCWKLHRVENRHFSCEGVCILCHHAGCNAADKREKEWSHCELCNRYFPSSNCFDNHLKCMDGVSKSVCEKKKKCMTCQKLVNTVNLPPENHHCGLIYCTICKDHVSKEHECYVKRVPNDPDKDEKRWAGSKVYYYDFETDSSTGVHTPVMVVYSNDTGN